MLLLPRFNSCKSTGVFACVCSSSLGDGRKVMCTEVSAVLLLWCQGVSCLLLPAVQPDESHTHTWPVPTPPSPPPMRSSSDLAFEVSDSRWAPSFKRGRVRRMDGPKMNLTKSQNMAPNCVLRLQIGHGYLGVVAISGYRCALASSCLLRRRGMNNVRLVHATTARNKKGNWQSMAEK